MNCSPDGLSLITWPRKHGHETRGTLPFRTERVYLPQRMVCACVYCAIYSGRTKIIPFGDISGRVRRGGKLLIRPDHQHGDKKGRIVQPRVKHLGNNACHARNTQALRRADRARSGPRTSTLGTSMPLALGLRGLVGCSCSATPSTKIPFALLHPAGACERPNQLCSLPALENPTALVRGWGCFRLIYSIYAGRPSM